MLENLQQDLHDARVLIEQSGTPEETKRYRKAAEIILVKALRANPGSDEAKALLQCARSSQSSVTIAETPRPSVVPQSGTVTAVAAAGPVPTPLSAAPPQPLAFSASAISSSSAAAKFDDELSFTASGPLFDDSQKRTKKSRLKSMLPFALIALAMFGAGFKLLSSRPAEPAPALAAPTSSRPEAASRPAVSAPQPAAVQQPEPVPVSPPTQTAAVIPQPNLTRVVTPALNVTSRETKPEESTPPPPPARIAVQINAKPWAQVYVDGPVRRSLGQTPLSGVSVPVGAVLVFENPNFTTKTHRIREADSAIQVEFQ